MTEADRRLLRDVALAPTSLERLLGSATLDAAVFEGSEVVDAAVFEGGPAASRSAELAGSAASPVSPFLTFAVAVHRTAAALDHATFVDERMGARRRIPVFDVAALREMLADPLRRYFFVELLASFTRVSSGVTWRRTPRGWRRQRFSELDPSRLASLLDVVPPEERPGVYRRLGDLSLFLLGVFPDHPPFPTGAAADRLLRQNGVRPDEADDLGGAALFERLGSAWYRSAIRLTEAAGLPPTGTLAVAAHVADHFSDARRVLNAVTDRYLFPLRSRWFPA